MSARISGWTPVCDNCGHDLDSTKATREDAEDYARTCDCTGDTCWECDG